jgi:hypothetical protein
MAGSVARVFSSRPIRLAAVAAADCASPHPVGRYGDGGRSWRLGSERRGGRAAEDLGDFEGYLGPFPAGGHQQPPPGQPVGVGVTRATLAEEVPPGLLLEAVGTQQCLFGQQSAE